MNLADMKGNDELEKKEFEMEFKEKQRKLELQDALKKNQKRFHAIVDLLGKEEAVELMEHLRVDEDIFDIDADCGVRSCRHCGACGGSGYEVVEWKEIKDEKGKQKKIIEDETELLLWEITCGLCGEQWQEYLYRID